MTRNQITIHTCLGPALITIIGAVLAYDGMMPKWFAILLLIHSFIIVVVGAEYDKTIS
jgi:hypothetical protein